MFLRWRCFACYFVRSWGKIIISTGFLLLIIIPTIHMLGPQALESLIGQWCMNKLHTLSISKLQILYGYRVLWLPWWLNGKESTCNVGDAGLILGSEKSPGEGNGNPLWYSSLGNAMDRGAWQATVHGITKELNMTYWLHNNNTLPFNFYNKSASNKQ